MTQTTHARADAGHDHRTDPIREHAHAAALAVTPARDASGLLDFPEYSDAVDAAAEWIEAAIRREVGR